MLDARIKDPLGCVEFGDIGCEEGEGEFSEERGEEFDHEII